MNVIITISRSRSPIAVALTFCLLIASFLAKAQTCTPTAYTVTGGAAYCASNLEVGLNQSDADVEYQLKLDGSDTGSPIAGTGSSISFGQQSVAGTYTVVGTSMDGNCTVTVSVTMAGSVTVSSNTLAAGALSGGGSYCVNTSPNDIEFTFSGTPPFDFTYTDGVMLTTILSHYSTTYVVSSPFDGTYSLTNLSNTCGAATNLGSAVTVTTFALPTISNISSSTYYCHGSSTDFTLSVEVATPSPFYGTLTYSHINTLYNINALSSDVSPSVSTTYTAIATDMNGCSGTLSIPVAVHDLPTGVISGGGFHCAGTPPSDVVFSFTGQSPFNFIYTIDGATQPTILTNTSNYTIQNPARGVYALYALEDNYCRAQSISGSSTVNESAKATISGNGTNFGPILLSASLPAGNEIATAFAWSGGSTPNVATNTFTTNGLYTVTVSSDNNCTTTAEKIVNLTTITSVTTPTTCGNNNGAIDLTLTGGLTQVRYVRLRQNAAAPIHLAEIQVIEALTGANLALNATPTASTVCCNDNYPMVNLVDENFSNFCHTELGIGEYVELDLGANYLIDKINIYNRQDCCGQNAENLQLILKNDAGTEVYSQQIDTYQAGLAGQITEWNVTDVLWSDGGTTIDRTALASGNYTFEYGDVNGTTQTYPHTINSSNSSFTVSIAGATTACDLTTLTAVANPALGTETFEWSSGQTTAAVTFTTSGIYNVKVTDVDGCTKMATVDVIVNKLATATVSSGGAICGSEPAPNVIFYLTGTPPFAFTYSNGTTDFTETAWTALTYVLIQPAVGIYTVKSLENICGISDTTTSITGSASVIVGTIPDNTITPSVFTICAGDSATLSIASNTVISSWSTGDYDVHSITVSPLSTDIYTVIVSNISGCSAIGSFQLGVYDVPTYNITGGGAYCNGGTSANLIFNFTGTPPFVFTYFDGTNSHNVTENTNAYTLTNPIDGTYTITALSDINCTQTIFSGSVTVVQSLPVSGMVSGGGVSCGGNSAPDVVFTLTGQPPFNITYNNGINNVLQTSTQNVYRLTNPAVGIYDIIAIENNCAIGTSLGYAIVSIGTVPDSTITPSASFVCAGTAVTLSLANNVATAQWGTGETSVPSITLTPTNSDIYTVVVSSADGCTAVGTLRVDVLDAPTATIQGGGASCPGVPLTNVYFIFTGHSPYNFTYTDGVNPAIDIVAYTRDTFYVNNTITGIYSVTALSNNCGTATILGTPISVSIKPLPTAVATTVATLCSSSTDVVFTFTGTPPFSFQYQDEFNAHQITGHNDLTYTLSNVANGYYGLVRLDDNYCSNDNINSGVAIANNVLVKADNYSICQGAAVPTESGIIADVIDNGIIVTSFSGNINAASSTFNRSSNANSYLASGYDCSYQPTTITITEEGSYSFDMCSEKDAYAHLYNNSFDPNNPATNYIISNDDGHNLVCALNPRITAYLTPGTYIYVATSFRESEIFSYTVTQRFTAETVVNWFTAVSGGSPIATGTTFDPISVAGSGITNTNTLGTTTFYASTNITPDCRTPVNFIIIDCENVYTATDTACHTFILNSVNGIGWYDIVDASGIIASINPNGLNLNKITVNISNLTNAPSVNGSQYMPRIIDITNEGDILPPFSSDYSLRLYYKDNEMNTLKTALNRPSLNVSDLSLSWSSDGLGCDLATYNGTTSGVIANTNIADVDYGKPNTSGGGLNGFYLQVELNHFTIFAPTATPAVLPINLISFTGRANEDANYLEWKVANERNFSHYELETSINGTNFKLLVQLPAFGKAEANLSSYNDKMPTTLSYYRLRMIDNDGSFKYSNIVSLRRNLKSFEVKNVYPNPTNNTTTIVYNSENDAAIDFEISDVLGVNLGIINAQAKSGINNQIIDLSNFPAGIYFITIKNGLNDAVVKRIIKE